MDALQTLAANVALNKMLKQSHFSICTIDDIIKVSGAIPDNYAYGILKLLHCVNYSDMDSGVRDELPNLLKRVLGSPAVSFDLSSGTYNAKPCLEISAPAKRVDFWI